VGVRGTWIGREPDARQPSADYDREEAPRLIVRTRCVLVADVVQIAADGSREYLLNGIDEGSARDFFQELTGRPWTATEMESASRPRLIQARPPEPSKRPVSPIRLPASQTA
jgi:hypothetical protein